MKTVPFQSAKILYLLLIVQIINVFDYMMVMPLGPDFTRSLAIPSSKLGWIAGVYTATACISSFLLSFILDKFERKRALMLSFGGLILSTFAAIFSQNFYQLLLARIIAGCFGGPTSSLVMSIVTDIFPAKERGTAMGKLMMGFSIASIFGIPFGLELARHWGWHAPFVFLSLVALIVWGILFIHLPVMDSHLQSHESSQDHLYKHLLEKKYLLSMALIALAIFSVFLIIPNIAAYVQFNRFWPREKMGLLYLYGGSLSIVATRFGGPWIDRVGVKIPAVLGSVLLMAVLWFGFVNYWDAIPISVYFACFMLSSSLRNMNAQVLITRVPPSHLRGGFMSLMNSLTHMSAAVGSFVSASLLSNEENGRLLGIESVSLFALVLSLGIPILIFALEKEVNKSLT